MNEAKSFLRFDPSQDQDFEFDVTLGLTHPQLAVRWVGREVILPSQPRIEHKGSPVAYIKYCVRGRGAFQVDGVRHIVKPGMVFWTDSKVHSILDLRGEAPLVDYVIAIFGRDVGLLLDRHLHSRSGITTLSHPEQVARIMEELMQEGMHSSDYRKENCVDLAMILMRRIDTHMTSSLKSRKKSRQSFWTCKKFIEEHYERINELGEVADACNLSIPYLCRLFEEFDDLRAYQYLSQLKLSKASRLLTTTRMSVTEISLSLGFNDLQRFCRNFKSLYGKCPTRYRKDHS
jgi:AraC-like DNA-binding protein